MQSDDKKSEQKDKVIVEQNSDQKNKQNNNSQKLPGQDQVEDNLTKLMSLAKKLSEKNNSNTEEGEDIQKKRKRYI